MSRQTSGNISLNPVYLSARSAIVIPERAIPVTIYALQKWLPRLGTERWSLIQFLRGLCMDAPRRPDGTKRVTSSWKFLGEALQVHEETIANWLRHEVIPGDKPWRRIMPIDDYAKYLSLFIPRLRYAYESRNGKTRRVGFLLEVLMEDPIAPEDEIRLAQQLELLRYEQAELGLAQQSTPQILNPAEIDSPPLSPLTINKLSDVNKTNPDLHHLHQSGQTRLTTQPVNRSYSDLQPNVKQYYPGSPLDVISISSDLQASKSEEIGKNVNNLNTLIKNLKQLKDQKRNYLQILEPIVVLTENLLEDYHSTAMLYKVLKILFPDYTDIYSLAVEEALVAYASNKSFKKGAIFVNTIRQLALEANIDLGFKTSEVTPIEHSLQADHLAETTPRPISSSAESTDLNSSLEDAIWSETLSKLAGRLTKGTFISVIQKTQLLSIDHDVYIVRVETTQAKDWLDNRLRPVVERALADVVGISPVKIDFRL